MKSQVLILYLYLISTNLGEQLSEIIGMTESYWQTYRAATSNHFMERVQNKFWQHVKQDLDRLKQPKHHLELYSMCKSQNPYIKQIKNSPNITTGTVAELICRDKACQLQYCQSILQMANQNRRRLIDLKGCKQQYDTMWNCIRNEHTRINRREQELKDLVYGIKPEIPQEIKLVKQKKMVEEQTQYI